MAKTLRVEQAYTMNQAEVREKMESVLGNMASKYDLTIEWESDTKVTITRSGVKGWAEIEPNRVVVELSLSFPVSALAGKVEEQLKHKMAKELQ